MYFKIFRKRIEGKIFEKSRNKNWKSFFKQKKNTQKKTPTTEKKNWTFVRIFVRNFQRKQKKKQTKKQNSHKFQSGKIRKKIN